MSNDNLRGFLWVGEDGGGGDAGGGTPAGTPAVGTADGGSPAIVPAGAAPTGAAPSGFSYPQDRSDWVPRHRFQEVNSQAQRAKDLESQLNQERQRVRALSGVETPSPDAAQRQKIREALLEVAPELKDLPDRLEAVKEVREQMAAADKEKWRQHGDRVVDQIGSTVANAMNVDALSTRQLSGLRSAFGAWIRATVDQEVATAGVSATLQKYERGDPSLVKTFADVYVEDWVKPGQRQVTAQAVNRARPTPNSAGRGAPVSGVKRPETFKNMDERMEYASALAKERGVVFRNN